MAQKTPQTFQNHTRFVPAYHMVAFPILAVNVLWSVYGLVRDVSMSTVMAALVAIALVILFFCARVFALTAQDRVIRLEMRLRLERLLPVAEHGRIGALTVDQFVALRFAGDDELPGLFRKVLDGPITNRKQIKRMVTSWTEDSLRV